MTLIHTDASNTGNSYQMPPEFLRSDETEDRNGLTTFDLIDQLIGECRARENAIVQTKAFLDEAYSTGVMKYFVDGAQLTYGNDYRISLPDNVDSAKACLRAEFWSRLLNHSQLLEVMPAAKRKMAKDQFSGLNCPAFDENTVRPTMEDLLNQRKTFFAERVDGIFRGLSGEHVTNQPSGFSKKMIINGLFDSFGLINHAKCAVISDLRGVVGRLTRRGEPTEYGTHKLLATLNRHHLGKKVSIDGGAFYCTLYKRGTIHFEVAPEVAIELNCILADLYPLAIPSKFRKISKSSKQVSFDMKTERLPMAVIDIISGMEYRQSHYSFSAIGKSVEDKEKAISVLESIGATVTRSADEYYTYVEFDYHAADVLEQIVFSGVIPEKVSHQFYRSLGDIATEAANRLDARPGHLCCEPSAGLGDLAQFLPKESTICVEISRIRAKVLAAKGYETVQDDFLAWAAGSSARFDRVLMNPPFSKGRAARHLKAAGELLAADGRIVAILPASMINTAPLPGFDHDWSEIYQDQFEGTSVQVVILTASHCK